MSLPKEVRMAGHSYLNVCLNKIMSQAEKHNVRIRNFRGRQSGTSYVRLLGIL